MTLKKGLLAGAALLLSVPLWMHIAVPRLQQIPVGFLYDADIASYDNLYDEAAGAYAGEKRSVTKFLYEATGMIGDTLMIRASFDVHTVTNDRIFAVERMYAIDRVTGAHVRSAGDRERDGWLFAPRHLQKGQPITTWFVNYNAPARLHFVGKEVISGLPVYRYETRFDGEHITQTENLLSLPDVGVTRGIELEPLLEVWIEPLTGHMVKYADDTVAYFYDLKTGKRLQPWNHFRNSFTPESVQRHVALARQERMKAIAIERMVPAALAIAGAAIALYMLRRKKTALIVITVLMVAGGVAFAAPWMSRTTDEVAVPGTVETLHLGAEAGLLASSVWVAEQNGYFTEEGLDVRIKEYGSGRAALKGLLEEGDLDIATVAQTPVVTESFSRRDFAVIAAMVSSQNDTKILVRKDRNILSPADLKGKRIGITKNSTGHYFLGLFLAQHGLDLDDVTVADIAAPDLAKAAGNGDVDAISTWEPHIYNAKKALAGNAMIFESEGTFREDFYFVAFRDWVRQHPGALQKFLRAINKANAFMAKYPAESQTIIAKRLQIDPGMVAATWNNFDFGLFLDQAVLLSFEQQARWILRNTTATNINLPNYLEFIWLDALEAALPDSVSIIR